MIFLMMALLVFPGAYLNEVLDLSANDISCHKFGTYQTELDTPNPIVEFSNAEGYDFLDAALAVKVGPP